MNEHELYRKYRPTLWKDVIGQPAAVAELRGFLEGGNLPHALLLSGRSGVGKTTLARIVALHKMKCDPNEYYEMNMADNRGIDTVRDLESRIRTRPMLGDQKVFFLDECHMLTKEAANAMLKMLEEPPDHTYFFLASSEPHRLIPAIMTRCTEIRLHPIDESDLEKLIQTVLQKDKKSLSAKVIRTVAEVAEGSARKALVLAQQCLQQPNEKAQLQILEPSEVKGNSEKLASTLLNSGSFNDVIPIIKAVREEKVDPESLRWAVMGYCSALLLSEKPPQKKKDRAYMILTAFEINWYDTKFNGLVRSCYEACK